MRARRRTRRQFLQDVAAVAAAGALAGIARAGDGPAAPAPGDGRTGTAEIPTRPLGRTGARVTIVGLGGWHLGVPAEKDGVALAQRAVDEGITFLDNAGDYHSGESERRMGLALAAGGRREKVFLMTKCCDHERTRDGSLRALDEALARLRTDHLDLWQLHDITKPDDPARCFAKGGAVEALEAAKKAGKVRFVGFTGHRDPKLHLEMLAHGFPFDTIQMPLNPADPNFKSFEREVLPKALERGMGVIGMKSLAGGALAKAGIASASEVRRYAVSVPGVSVTVCGIDTEQVLAQDLALARGFKAMGEEERKALSARFAEMNVEGKGEWYKRL
ncbi:MAG TPA: aldo/keto reductase [Planctomycetota bacterium]|nr:aldo/keto reductase [Planctomycetota bacterium]